MEILKCRQCDWQGSIDEVGIRYVQRLPDPTDMEPCCPKCGSFALEDLSG